MRPPGYHRSDKHNCEFGTHSNVINDWSIPDPHLTKLGKEQAQAIPTTYPALFDHVDTILSSPMRRTIETTLIGFPRLEKDKRVKLELLPEL